MNKAIDKISGIFQIASCVVFTVVILITFLNIVGRTLFNAPIKGTPEAIQYGVLLTVSLIMARTGFEKRHVVVDLIVMNLGPRAGKFFYAFGCVCGTVVFGGIGYLSLGDMIEYIGGRTTEAFHIPYSVIYGVIFAGFVLGALVFLYQFADAVVRIIKNDCGPDLRKVDKTVLAAEAAEKGEL